MKEYKFKYLRIRIANYKVLEKSLYINILPALFIYRPYSCDFAIEIAWLQWGIAFKFNS